MRIIGILKKIFYSNSRLSYSKIWLFFGVILFIFLISIQIFGIRDLPFYELNIIYWLFVIVILILEYIIDKRIR